MRAKEFIPASKPRNFVAKNQKTAGAGAHKDKKRAEKQGDTKHKKSLIPMETALRDKEDYQAKRKALDDLGRNKDVDQKAVQQRRLDLDKEARQKGVEEGWKDKVAAAGLAGAMAFGAGGAHARVSGDQDPNINRLTGKPIAAQQATDNTPAKAEAPKGFSKEYLQAVVDGKHPRPMISVEKAQQLLKNMSEATYQHGFADPKAPSLGTQDKRDFKRAELQHELGHETNNIAIAINGKTWKVIRGKGTADSNEERQYLNNMKTWAEKKSASSGKKWTVHLTGAEPTE